ncbi:MAG: hypothetical protein EXR71_00965, partial [Myxococcales bacterium]|nr:hypothetical protein [Myxococcales bacterium]
MRPMLKLSLVSLLALAAAFPAHAATLDVDASGSATYTTISDAIAAAIDGDLIRVETGTYAEAIDFDGKMLTIYSRSGSASTIIDAGGAASWAVQATSGEAPGTTLQGFTVRNTGDGGIYVYNADFALDDVVVEDLGSTGYYGPGLYAASSSVTVANSAFSGITGYVGGAVYASASTLDFSNTTFSDNWSYYGSAMFLTGSDATLTDSTVDANESYYGGPGIYAYASSTVVGTNLAITNNISGYGYGAGLLVSTSSDATLTGGEISDNVATYATSGYYGAVWIETNSTLSATSVTFARNEGYGGSAVTLYNYSEGTFDDCTFEDNTSLYYGALQLSASDATVTNSTFTGNTSGGYGAGIFASSAFTLDVTGSTFDSNVATYYGGAIYAYYYGEVAIADSTFEDNEASYGGAIWAQQLYDVITLSDSTFSGNEASSGTGGAMYAYYYAEVD